MLSCIVLSTILAICSTAFVLPWFWISLITRRTIVGDEKHRGINEGKDELKLFLKKQGICFVFIFSVSMLTFTAACVRRTWFGASMSIVLIIFINMIRLYDGHNKYQNIKEKILFGFIILIAVLGFIRLGLDYSPDIMNEIKPKEFPVTVTVWKDGKQVVPSSRTIKELFDVDSASGPTYTNHKFVYKVSNPSGIVVIDELNADKAQFIECKLNNLDRIPFKMRNLYPTDMIAYQDVQVSDDYVPFEKYWIIAGDSFFSQPTLRKCLLQNLETGEITEYLPDEIPDFAR